jgi:hypothetical protein
VGRPGLEPGTYGLKVAIFAGQSHLPALIHRLHARKAQNARAIGGTCFHDCFHATAGRVTATATESDAAARGSAADLLVGLTAFSHRQLGAGAAPRVAGDHLMLPSQATSVRSTGLR